MKWSARQFRSYHSAHCPLALAFVPLCCELPAVIMDSLTAGTITVVFSHDRADASIKIADKR
ncbi:hypothetical protein KCP71_22485 [Salmonella enterica subsp. enterica]|nr:hypothetical protein KCP71_22485 [Salmonella enterica subsp. enterica]